MSSGSEDSFTDTMLSVETLERSGSSGGKPDSEAPGLPLDQVFDVLRNERRRLVLARLSETEGPHTIGELAEHVASYENDKPVAQLSSDERKRAYVGLYQCHLPKMDAMQVVVFNKNRGRVEIGPNYSLVMPYLEMETSEGPEQNWPRRYLSLSLATAVLVGLSVLAAPAAVPVAAGIVVLLLSTMSVYHWWAYSSAEESDGIDLPSLRAKP